MQKWHLNSNKIKQATPACSELKGSLFSKMFEQSMEHDKRTRTLWKCQVIKYVVLSKRWMSRKKSATQKRVEREETFTFWCYQSYFEKQLCDELFNYHSHPFHVRLIIRLKWIWPTLTHTHTHTYKVEIKRCSFSHSTIRLYFRVQFLCPSSKTKISPIVSRLIWRHFNWQLTPLIAHNSRLTST